MKRLLSQSFPKSVFLILILGFLLIGTQKVTAAGSVLITSADDLTAAMLNAKDGDTILVGDITFQPMPSGLILVPKNITVKSGKEMNAVFTNATFALNGTKTISSPLTVKFVNIDFRGDGYGTPIDPDSPPPIQSEMPGIMKTMCAAILRMNVDVTYKGCSFDGYHYGYGGVINAIYPDDEINDALKITLDHCSFRNNASKYGGCIYLSGYAHNIRMDARHCEFEGNAASTGGAVWAQDADVFFLDCSFLGSRYLKTETESPDGGALTFRNCSAELDGCLIADNVSGGRGAGLFCEIAPFKTLIMENCTLIGNKAAEDEGISVFPAKTNFDTKAVAHVSFSSLIGKQSFADNAELFGCLLVDKDAAPGEPCEENGFCLKLTPENALEKGLDPTSREHVSLPKEGFPVPEEATNKIAGGKFSDSMGKLHIGDNYEKEASVEIEYSPGNVKTVTAAYGDEIVLKTPERKGYSFEGWEYPKGTPIGSGMVFIGGELPEARITARWHFLLSENLYVIWVPLLVLAAVGIVVFTFCRRKEKAETVAVSEAETAAEETVPLPDGWIDRVCRKPEVAETLSKRETEVLRKLLEGKSRRQIAEELFVTEATIKKHSAGIYAKLNVHNKTELIYKLTKQ